MCPFKFYCDNILKLNTYQETFDTWLGSLCHYILSQIYNDNFDFEKTKIEFINSKPFELTNENKFFLNKILNELQSAIKHIKSFQNITKYQTIETEKNIETTINNIKFTGIIDKIMHYDNNIVLIDYKTGTPNIDLSLVNHGLNLQLPTYIYLIKQIYPDSKIVGIYLQHILKPNFNKDTNLSIKDQYQKSLKLTGYSLGNEEYLNDFDPTYIDSDYIKGLKLTNNGFSQTSKLLTEKNFQKLEQLVNNKITECIENINKGHYPITPKYLDDQNITCNYCPYKSICFYNEKDYTYLKKDNNLSFLEGDNNELE